MSSTYLFELGCEELPSSTLPKLASDLESSAELKLNEAGVSYESLEIIAAPRRLGIVIHSVGENTRDRSIERRGPAAKAAYDGSGQPTKALEGFCRGLGVTADQVELEETAKGAWVVYRGIERGEAVHKVLGEIMADVIRHLPLSKSMRWGSGRDEFPRPVHWIVSLLGTDVVPCKLFGNEAGRTSYGHRFHAPDEIELSDASKYSEVMRRAYVIPNLQERTAVCWAQIESTAAAHSVSVEPDESLLQEIACLVEWPVALCGEFDSAFLEVPDVALIAAMRGHQKYFHTRTEDTKQLSNRFITVANIESIDPSQVLRGNQRVIRARLADAAFFYETDNAQPLEQNRGALDTITFHPKLGSLGDKTERVIALSRLLAGLIGISEADAETASRLSRCDLVSEMVLEFDELQGTIGSIYAARDGYDQSIVSAIRDFYSPAGVDDAIPENALGCVVSLADKLDTLCGLFAIKQPPTGSKDPFALRRAAIGILRINEHKQMGLDLEPVVAAALEGLAIDHEPQVTSDVMQFILDRQRVRLTDEGVRHDLVMAAQASHKLNTARGVAVIDALQKIVAHEDFEAIVEGNKRATNLLAKFEGPVPEISSELFQDEVETRLFEALSKSASKLDEHVSRETFDEALAVLVELKNPIDEFFASVMINADDIDVRANRYALLKSVRDNIFKVADISLIQA